MRENNKLGPRDERRFCSVEKEEQEYLAFQVDLCLTVLSKRPFQLEALHSGAAALTALGYYKDGLELDRRLAKTEQNDSMVIYNLACSEALCGMSDESLEHLQQAIDLGYEDLEHIADDPDLESLRGHYRFEALVKPNHAHA